MPFDRAKRTMDSTVQEIGYILHVLDEIELMAQLVATFRQFFGITLCDPLQVSFSNVLRIQAVF